MSTPHPDVSSQADLDALLHGEGLAPLPQKRGEPVFRDSWEAEAYAMGNLLVKEGHIVPAQWMERMAAAIASAQAGGDPDCGDTYYHHWCAALESLCFDRDWISPDLYQQQLDLWGHAIANTPHGVPLALENASAPPCGQEHGHHHDQGNHGHHHHPEHNHSHNHSQSHNHQPDAPPPAHFWTPIHRSRLKPPGPSA